MTVLKLSAVALAAFAATGAHAATFTEGFDAPFVGWESRWFGTQSNAFNYYVSESPDNPAHEHQGGPDVTGMWLSDGDSYRDGGAYGEIHIRFDAAFAAQLTSFSMDVATALPDGVALTFFDMDGVALESLIVPGSPVSVYWTPIGYNNVSVTSTNGIGGFSFLGHAQGSTIIDNLVATTAPVPEPASWGLMIVGFGAMGAALRRRGAVTSSVRFA